MKSVTSLVTAALLALSSLAAQSAPASKFVAQTHTGQVTSVQVTGSGGEASQELVTDVGDQAFRVGTDVAPAVFASFTATLLSAMQMKCNVTVSWIPAPLGGTPTMTWVLLESSKCAR